MAGNMQDDVDRALAAFGAEPIKYHSFNNSKRVVARQPAAPPGGVEFFEAADGDAGIASDNAETDLAQTYLARWPAAEATATRPIYQAAPLPAYAPSVTISDTLSRFAAPELALSLSHIGHGPIAAPPPVANFAYQAAHLATSPVELIPMQQYHPPLGPQTPQFNPIAAAVASPAIEAPRSAEAARPVEAPAPVQMPRPVPPSYAVPPYAVPPQPQVVPAVAPLAPPAVAAAATAAWQIFANRPTPPLPLPEPARPSAPSKLGSVEDLFRMLATPADAPPHAAAQTAPTPAHAAAATAAWQIFANRPTPPLPLPEPARPSAPSKLGSVEDLFRMLATPADAPPHAAAQTAPTPAHWLNDAATRLPLAAVRPEPEAYPPFASAHGRPRSPFALGQPNPAPMRSVAGAASRFASQAQPVLRAEALAGVDDLFRRL